jgi:DNA-binding NarL/FixJ family response regulator
VATVAGVDDHPTLDAMQQDSSSGPIRVLIVDDDAMVRAALTMILAGSDQVLLVGEATDGNQVAAAVREHAPDVVLMDIRMPRMDGLAATELLCKQPSPPEIIILTTFDADEYVLRAVRAGASGFLLKDTPPVDLIRAIQLVAAGDAMLSPAVTRKVLAHVTEPAESTRQSRACSPSSANANARSQWLLGRASQMPRSALTCS